MKIDFLAVLVTVLWAPALAAVLPRFGEELPVDPPNTTHLSIHGFIALGDSGVLATSRIDPLSNPNDIAGHVHQIMGASGFRSVLNNPEDQQKSQCTSMKVTADKSSYWTPTLYWINDDNTFTAMSSRTSIHYKLRNVTTPIMAFPQGLRMISGLPTHRDPGAAQTQGVRGALEAFVNILPTGTTHPDPPGQAYVQMNIAFPNCGWANQSLDSWDHFSHMSWPVNYAGEWQDDAGTCPESHPVMYPQIIIESLFYLEPWMKKAIKNKKSNFAISNGDTTGITWHGGFVAGWDTDVLQAAIEHCSHVGDQLQNCTAFKGLLHLSGNTTQEDCRIQTQIPDEEVGLFRSVHRLPGCNPLWDRDGPVIKPTHCPWYVKPGWTSPNLEYMGGPAPYLRPLVLPGVDTSNINSLPCLSEIRWNETNVTHVPTIALWTKDRTGKNLTTVLVGTQDDVDRNRVEIKGKNDKPQGYNMSTWSNTSWTDMAPVDHGITATRLQSMTSGTVANVKKNRHCPVSQPWYGFPCSEDEPPAVDPLKNVFVSVIKAPSDVNASTASGSEASEEASIALDKAVSPGDLRIAAADPGAASGSSSATEPQPTDSPSSDRTALGDFGTPGTLGNVGSLGDPASALARATSAASMTTLPSAAVQDHSDVSATRSETALGEKPTSGSSKKCSVRRRSGRSKHHGSWM